MLLSFNLTKKKEIFKSLDSGYKAPVIIYMLVIILTWNMSRPICDFLTLALFFFS